MDLLGEDIGGESPLYLTKWWDYRFEHPMRSTFRFAIDYYKAWDFIAPRRHCITEVLSLCPVRISYERIDPCAQTESVSHALWEARRASDILGIPYWFFCVTGLSYSEKASWPNLATPETLTGDKILAYINERWVAENAQHLKLPTHEAYKAENFVGHVAQVDFLMEFADHARFRGWEAARIWDVWGDKLFAKRQFEEFFAVSA